MRTDYLPPGGSLYFHLVEGNGKPYLVVPRRKTTIVESLDKIKIFIFPYGPLLKSVENRCFGALRGAMRAPRSPGTRISGEIRKKK